MTCFEDLMNAGKVDEKAVKFRGMELSVKPLTLEENAKVSKLQEEGKTSEAIVAMIGYSVVSPKIGAVEMAKMKNLDANFIRDLSEAIANAVKVESGDAEKN